MDKPLSTGETNARKRVGLSWLKPLGPLYVGKMATCPDALLGLRGSSKRVKHHHHPASTPAPTIRRVDDGKEKEMPAIVRWL